MSNSSFYIKQLNHFITLWQHNFSDDVGNLFTPNIELYTSHRGSTASFEEVLSHLKTDFPSSLKTEIYTSNIVEKMFPETNQVSAYFYGSTIGQNETTSFGGMVILKFKHQLISEIKIQINWFEGSQQFFSDWFMPLNRLWKPNDPKATAIISELDALWHSTSLSENTEQQILNSKELIAETWYRYAWGLDLADTHLYIDTFTETAIVKLPPMGTLTGKREIISTLKAFRMPWPSIQHYGEPLDININHEEKTATMIIGRIIPQQARDEQGGSIYGAHYQIELKLERYWKIHRMDYIPGWIRAA